jgi:hypothetical protein
MRTSEPAPLRLHEDSGLFEAALRFTEARTGFSRRLVEKDYFCTAVLAYLAGVEGLVFKGGTCLAKVHASFYRLSEDLDFVIPTPSDATRRQRSVRTAALKEAVAALPAHLPMLRLRDPLCGANESVQYLAMLAYDSVVTEGEETIELEIGLREPLLEAAIVAPAATILLDPAADAAYVGPIALTCMALREAMAEKSRAALTRREPAIRDFFDLDYAMRRLGVDLGEPALLAMVGAKLRVPGNGPIDLSARRLDVLRVQLRTELEPVLRPADLAAFDLDRAFRIVADIAAKIRD